MTSITFNAPPLRRIFNRVCLVCRGGLSRLVWPNPRSEACLFCATVSGTDLIPERVFDGWRIVNGELEATMSEEQMREAGGSALAVLHYRDSAWSDPKVQPVESPSFFRAARYGTSKPYRCLTIFQPTVPQLV